MQVKLLHDLVEEMAGEGNGRIVEILFGKKDVNEFSIAKKMELTINQVRNILYKLSADGLVSFIRKKDKRKGWYIYYWTLKTEKCLVKLEQSLLNKIAHLEGQLGSRETKSFYICKPCGIEVSEEKAIEDMYTCEECAEPYELSDNSGPIRDAKSKITRIQKDLALIRTELETLREQERRRRKRADKKTAKAEAARKLLIKEARAKARAKIAKAKGIVKKKVKKVKKKVAKKVKKTTKKVAKKVKKTTKKVAKKDVKKKAAKKVRKVVKSTKKVAKKVKKTTKKVKKNVKKKVTSKNRRAFGKKVSKFLKGGSIRNKKSSKSKNSKAKRK